MNATRLRSVRRAFHGRHLLVTGVTGFLGKVWLSMVLDRLPEVERITVLARGKKGCGAEARMREIFERSPALRPIREKHGTAFRELVAEKVRVVDATLSAPLCGLSRAEARALMADVDCVVHFAGLTDFEPDPLSSLEANVHGAHNVADLAALTAGKRYVHVSTTYVAGGVSREVDETLTRGIGPNGTVFDPEEELAELTRELATLPDKKDRIRRATERAERLGWVNIYTYSKGLSEHLLAGRTDVHTTTVRPAIVECARSFPFTGWNEGVNTSGPIVWLLSTAFRRFPSRANNHFDVVPVDTVARGVTLATAAALEDRAREVYQIASSHSNPLTFDRAVELTALAYRKIHKERGEGFFEKRVLRHLESFPLDAPEPEVMPMAEQRRLAQALRGALKADRFRDVLPVALDRRVGEDLGSKVKSWSMNCRQTDRRLGTLTDMLKAYRPFIHDHDWVFRTDHLQSETEALADDERDEFGFDIGDLCWRHYWMKVQVPGLEKWSIPILRGDKVYDDEPLPLEPRETLAPIETSVRERVSL